MNRMLWLLITVLTAVMIQSCATKERSVMRQDPLINKIISTRTVESVSFNTLIKDIGNYDVIYLSEKHNNPEHHKIQQRIIQNLINSGKNPSIGFEFFSMEHTPDLLNFTDSGKVEHAKKTEEIIEADLRKKLGWDTQSDEMWKYYFDILAIAKKERLKIAGIDIAPSLKKRITRKGIDNLSPIEKEMIFATEPPDESYKDYMYSILKAVHCGMGSEKMQSKLYDTWVARNDKMALSITQLVKHGSGPVVIIIGRGHTEYGLGVINRVENIDNNITQVNIDLQEISVNPSELSQYIQPLELQGYKPVPPADYLWFTQRVSYKDPCREFEKTLKKMKKQKMSLKQ